MTYAEATLHATWDEALVYALGYAAERQAQGIHGFGRLWLQNLGTRCIEQACSRTVTHEEKLRGDYEYRMAHYPMPPRSGRVVWS